MGLFERAAALGRVAGLAFRDAYGYMNPWVYTLFLLIRPVSQVLFFGLAARFATGQADVSFQTIGNAVQVCVLSSLHGTADVLVSERANGTLPLVTLAARQKFLVFAGRLLVVGMHGLITSTFALVAAGLIFGLDFSQVNWLALLAALLVSVLATSCLGVALGSAGLVMTDINLIGNVAAMGLMAIAGINFPVAWMPRWLQAVAYALPMTRGAEAARLAFSGGGPGFAGLLVGELLIGAVWLTAGYGLLLFLENRARVKGTLDLY